MIISKVLIAVLVVAGLFLSVAPAAVARDDHLLMDINAALKTGKDKHVVDKGIKLFFAKQPFPKGAKIINTLKSNRKTNAFRKSDVEACNWAFLSAIKSLQEDARNSGANAIVEIKSIYRGTNTESETQYLCGAGSIMAGVALEGKAAKIP